MLPTGSTVHLAVYALLAVLLGWMGLRWFERVNLYMPSRTHYAHPGTYGHEYEEMNVHADDGPLIHGWYIDGGPDSPVLLVCHGNGGNITHRLEKLDIFRKAGASVLLFDYRGYGKSSGSPSEDGTYRDADAAYRWLVETKGVDPKRIVIYGESLGGGVATETAMRHRSAGLILDSSFTSTVDMGKEIFPFLPVEMLVRYRYDNIAKIPGLKVPLLVMHSPQDEIIPFKMGRRLFLAAPEPKTFLEMRGDHNGGFLITGPAYGEAIASFLRELGF